MSPIKIQEPTGMWTPPPKPRLGVDVDLVLVRTDLHWDDWLMSQCGEVKSRLPDSNADYNISVYYPEVENPMDFWRCENLYDNLHPASCSNILLRNLDSHFDIVYISSIKGNHHKSKYYFIEKYFPKGVGFIATKEKHLVDVDIMIDDRASVLKKFNKDVYKILYQTEYNQGVTHNLSETSTWSEVYQKCIDYLEVKNCLDERREKARRQAL